MSSPDLNPIFGRGSSGESGYSDEKETKLKPWAVAVFVALFLILLLTIVRSFM